MRPASIVAALTVLLALLLPARHSTSASAASASTSHALTQLQHLPVAFELNRGQLDGRVRFTAHAGSSTLFLTDTEAVIATLQGGPRTGIAASRARALQMQQAARAHRSPAPVTETVVRLHPLGQSAHPTISALQRLPGVVNDYIGNNPQRWRTGIPTFARVTYSNVYPGIDLTYHGYRGSSAGTRLRVRGPAGGSQLEYDWIVHPGADPARIHLSVSGPGRLALDRSGSLHLTGSGMQLVMNAPHVYQILGGRRQAVSGSFALTAGHIVSFHLGQYDRNQTLVVDPTFTASGTYLGGTGDESVTGVKIDSQLHTLIEGDSNSATFPTGSQTSFQSPALGDTNMYVACISADLNTLLWVTRIGGKTPSVQGFPAATYGSALDLGADDSVYAGGATSVTDIPLLSPFQKSNLLFTGYLVKLSATGQLVLASTVGGATGTDSVAALATDRSNGDLFVGMDTSSSDLPTHAGVLQPVYPNLKCPTGQGNTTVPCLAGFLLHITGIGSGGTPTEADGTYIAGTTVGNTFIHNVAIGPTHTVYVTGSTASSALPVTSGAFHASGAPSVQNAYAGALSPTFAAASAYLSFANPGTVTSNGNSLAVDATDLIVGVNTYTPAANNTTQIAGYLSDWPLGSSGFPSGNPTFSTLAQLEGISSSIFTTYIADTSFVRGWNSTSDPFALNGMPLELSQNYIATAGGTVVDFEGVVLVNNHAFGSSGIGPVILNGGGKNDLAAPVDSVYSASDGWHTRVGVIVAGPVSGFLSAIGPVAQNRAIHSSSRAAAAQSSYAGGLDAYVLGIDRPIPAAVPTATPTPTATATPKPATKCPKNSSKKKGKCVCKKGYVMKKGKCVKKKK